MGEAQDDLSDSSGRDRSDPISDSADVYIFTVVYLDDLYFCYCLFYIIVGQ